LSNTGKPKVEFKTHHCILKNNGGMVVYALKKKR